MIIHDFHIHTTYSHGKCTPSEVAEIAVKKGLKMIAISDHSFGNSYYGVSEDSFRQLRAEIDELNVRYKGTLRILLGAELNLLGNGLVDMPRSVTPNVTLLGYHKGVRITNKFAREALAEALFGLSRNAQRNTDEILHAIDNADVNIIAHPGEYISIDIGRLARAAAERNILLEINNRHVTLTADDLRLCADCGARFVISSDAHEACAIGEYNNAVAVATEADVLPLVVNWRTDT